MKSILLAASLASLAYAADRAPQEPQKERKVLFWYDPMYPNTKFDAPGQSPFMDMDLVPKYAEDAEREGFKIDAAQRQNLGLRTAIAATGRLDFSRRFPAILEFNGYQKAIVQHRASGFVLKAYPVAAGDLTKKGDPLCEVTIAEWIDAQSEYIVTKSEKALSRLRLAGMSEEEVEALKKRLTVKTNFVMRAPIDGVLSEFNMREGMNFDRTDVIARIEGIDPIWINAFIPEKLAFKLEKAEFSAIVGEKEYALKNARLLAGANAETKTIVLRAEISNKNYELRPNLNALIKATIKGEPQILVPSRAVIDDGVTPRVITVDSEGYFLPKAVKILAEANGYSSVEGLKEGETVVETGLFLIDSEANINGALDRLKKND
jgi:Cu(I)/Ag(I) efflux system membrane fusion protein